MSHERNHFPVELEVHKRVMPKAARSSRREAASHEGLIQHIALAPGSVSPSLESRAIGRRLSSPRCRSN